jgi:hypothetical protein
MGRLSAPQMAARVMGLKLLLFSVSLAAVGAVPGMSDQSLADATWGGMKLLHFVLGAMGAGASLFFLPQFNGKWLGATVTCGILCAVVGTPALGLIWVEYVPWTKGPLPGPVENLLAMALGVAGVNIIPALQRGAEAFRANPLAFFDWLRGRGSPPPPPEDKGGRP